MRRTDLKSQVDFKVLAILILIAALGYGAYAYFNLRDERTKLQGELAQSQDQLQKANEENTRLNNELQAEQAKIRTLVEEVSKISGTVGILEKLQKTDPELLQKYSKVYFLNENYVPSELAAIPSNYLFGSGETEEIHARVWPHLERMLRAASSAGLDLKVLSSYRSFGEQSSLKAGYKVTYGSGANKFSADQGYSEHQLGTTVDFTTSNIGSGLNGFEKTAEYEWLVQNASKYGFTLSYPEGNSYYIFEPWHWRFVGLNLADYLFTAKKFFYDLDQREIDQYLVNIFD